MTQRNDDRPPPSVAREVAAVCRAFEQEWQAGQQPRIESHLAKVSDASRSDALSGLIQLELSLCQSGDESADLETYLQRFPDHTDEVQAAIDTASYVKLASTRSMKGNVEETEDAVQPPSETKDIEPNTLIGRYRIERLLGKGTFGQVYLARDEELQRLVAVKVPHRERLRSPEDMDAYIAEARVLASLDHPHVLPVHDVGRTEDGLCYVVSKLVEGNDLATYAKEHELSCGQVARLLATVAEALQHTHNRGLVHRDIKPANILVDATGEAYLADFGLALKDEDFRTQLGTAGTPAYMSPEQVRGEWHRIDGRSDIFSLGVVLYELLTDVRPFQAESVTGVLQEIVSSDVRPPRERNDSIPQELERICLKALCKRATDRYVCAADMAHDLKNHEHLDASEVDEARPLKIVPKGLRSFDAADAAFFLELMPGPRDRDGLPESIRFWKTRIEAMDADQTFNVGVVYGPSGCGKSSLVKAGLLPLLADHVTRVFVEATPGGTEARLLAGLHQASPDLPPDASLTATLAALRRGRGIPAGRKVLVILDQFEQWLHARRKETSTELVAALRHCDGRRIQCLVLVRDDFWLAASRFMRDLEIPLVEGKNSCLVDLFDPLHARQVLAEFGKAFGRLPAELGNISSVEQEFLDEAIRGISQDGKVISVRLALFAQMMKDKPWTPAALRAVGGTEGLGVTFLENTFGDSTAPPEHRLHQKAARAVLESLLPEPGSDIKGSMRSHAELLETAGYLRRVRDFDDLLQILDTQLRLITPTSPEAPDAEAGAAAKYYQLTHDYLVPALREWLTNKQKETRRGRAELRLADRASLWQSRPENRHLPSFWEFSSIVGFTKRRTWTQMQQEMMRKAAWFHGLRCAILSGALVAIAVLGAAIWHGLDKQRRLDRSDSLVSRLLDAKVSEVPRIIAEIDANRQYADARLRAEMGRADLPSSPRLHASLALLPVDAGQTEYLVGRLLSAQPEEFAIIAESLAEHHAELLEPAWSVVEDPASEGPQRLRAAAFVAKYDPENERWRAVAPDVCAGLLSVSPTAIGPWMETLRPVREVLCGPLRDVFGDRKADQLQRSLATAVLADYLKDDASQVADLLVGADERQFQTLFPVLAAHGDDAVQRLTDQLQSSRQPDWNDGPLDPSWQTPDRSASSAVETAHGVLSDRFAFCQALPLEDLDTTAEALGKAGYRPTRLRPYSVGEAAHAAVVWTRDAKLWRLAHGLSADELRARDEAYRNESLDPLDVSGYLTPEGPRFAALWGEAPQGTATGHLEVAMDAAAWSAKPAALSGQGYRLATHSVLALPDGTVQHCATWVRASQALSYERAFLGMEWDFAGELYPGELQVDVDVAHFRPQVDTQQRLSQQVREADRQLSDNAANPIGARLQRGLAYVYLGEDEKALEDLNWLVERLPTYAGTFQCRAVALARLGRAEEARADLAKLGELHVDPAQMVYLDAIVAAYLGEVDEGMQRLEAILKANANRANLRYYAASAYSRASEIAAPTDANESQAFADRAVALLRDAVAARCAECGIVQEDPDFDPIRQHPGYLDLIDGQGLGRRYAAIWHPDVGRTSIELHNLDASEHLARGRELASQAYRPVSLAVVETPSGRTSAASVWHRPILTEQQRRDASQRKANAAVALTKMGRAEYLWPLLKQDPAPHVRSDLIHALSTLGADGREMLRRLEQEPDLGVQRALLQCLGEFDVSSFPPEDRAAAKQAVRQRFLVASDPGVHGSAEWTLRRWGEDLWAKQKLQQWASDSGHREQALQRIGEEFSRGNEDAQWYVNAAGDTLTCVPGPIEFLMGSPSAEAGRLVDETLHRRRIDRSFALATKPVTVAQFARFRQDHNVQSQFAPTGDCPVHCVSWYLAASYCNWLSDQEGMAESEFCYEPNEQGEYAAGMKLAENHLQRTGYRLPTEAEWEYMCRAGTTTSRYYGESQELLGQYGWYVLNSSQKSWPVGSLKPNDLGLFDMHGNVWTWCLDRHERSTLPRAGEVVQYREPALEIRDADKREVRGGSFYFPANNLRSAQRLGESPHEQIKTSIGFRVARTLR